MSTTLKASNTPLESLSKKPAFKDALDYLEAIKRTFRDSPAKYNSFLDIMKVCVGLQPSTGHLVTICLALPCCALFVYL